MLEAQLGPLFASNDKNRRKRMEVSDSVTVTEKITITVFQSGGLVSHTRLLAKMAAEENEYKIVALATATILMGAAALEALLSEAAHILKPGLYDKRNYRMCGVPDKFKKLMGYESQDVKSIWDARKAVAHSEPHNSRSRFVGEILNAKGAKWVIETIEIVSNDVWGESMPNWFKEGANMA
jgi:hypothetical protein